MFKVDEETLRFTLTFHTGSAVVFFRGGALKFSIRFKAAENRNIIEIYECLKSLIFL